MNSLLKLSLAAFLCLPAMLVAQDATVKKLQAEAFKPIKKDDADTSSKRWKKGGFISLNVTQSNLSNWSAGGDEYSLSITSVMNGFAFYKNGRHTWDNTIDVNLGYIKTTSLGGRKNDDRIDVTSKYGYALNKSISLSGYFNTRTQFFDGFTYPNNVKTFSSTAFAPAYIVVAAGFDWKPIPGLSVFFSPATSRWVLVNNPTLSAAGLYGVKPGEKSAYEIGAYAAATYTTNITKTLSYRGKLELFSNYRRNPQNIDVFMTNLFALKISKVLSATWNFDLIYDDDVRLFGPNKTSAALQRKSLIGAGLLVKL